MSNNAKVMRGQLRQIVKEMLPEILSGELLATIQNDNTKRLEEVKTMVRDALTQMDNRSKNVQDMIVRLTSNPLPAPTEEVKS